MDKIFIHGLELFIIIGIYPHERNTTQSILLDLELGVDVRVASASDSITQTIDYDDLTKQVKLYATHTEFFLIETLAEHVAQFILQNFNIHWLRLCLTKPGAVANAQKIGIIIERTTSQYHS